jgi:hypothetical protein
LRSLLKSDSIGYDKVRGQGVVVMTIASLSQDLCGFAVELPKLAYTMPAGHEDPLIRLSERMVRHAQAQASDSRIHRTG